MARTKVWKSRAKLAGVAAFAVAAVAVPVLFIIMVRPFEPSVPQPVRYVVTLLIIVGTFCSAVAAAKGASEYFDSSEQSSS